MRCTIAESVAAGSGGIELAIDTSSASERVAGRVIDPEGEAVPGARVTLALTLPTNQVSWKGMLARSRTVTTDARGRFEFADVSPGAQPGVEPPSAVLTSAGMSWNGSGDRENLVLQLRAVRFVQVEFSEGALPEDKYPTDAYALTAPDPVSGHHLAGGQMEASRFDHPDPRYRGTRRTGVFPVADTARFIRVRHAGEIVMTIPVELEQGRVNLVRR